MSRGKLLAPLCRLDTVPMSAFSLGSAGAGQRRTTGFNSLKLEALATLFSDQPSRDLEEGAYLFMGGGVYPGG